MSTIRALRLGMSATIALPGYNNVKPSVSVSVEVGEGEDLSEAFASAQKKLRALFRLEAAGQVETGRVLAQGIDAYLAAI